METLTPQYRSVERYTTVDFAGTAPQQVKSSAGSQPKVETRPRSTSFFLQADAPSKDVGFNAAKRHFVGFIRYVSNCFAPDAGDKKSQQQALIEAAQQGKGSAAALQDALKSNVNINHVDKNGKTAIMHAAEKGDLNAIHVLIAAGSGLNMQDSDGNTALLLAAKNGHLEVVRCLIQWGAEVGIVNEKSEQGRNALTIAAENGHIKVVELLLSQKAYLDPAGKDRLKALSVAHEKGHAGVVDLFVNGESTSTLAKRILLFAASNKLTTVVEALLSRGTPVDCYDKDGETAMLKAVRSGGVEIVEVLIKKGADVNKVNDKSETPLMLAVEYGQIGLVKTLLEHEAQVDLVDQNKDSALIRACRSNQDKIVKLLLDKNANVNLANSRRSTALILAVENGNEDIVNLLTSKNVIKEQINTFNLSGMNALLIAAGSGKIRIVKQLLACGANSQVFDPNGFALLTRAVHSRNVALVKYLINNIRFHKSVLKQALHGSWNREVSEALRLKLKEMKVKQA